MKLHRLFGLAALAAAAAAAGAADVADTTPSTIDELVARAFAAGAAPRFEPLPSTPQVAVASNDTATLKIMDLKVSSLPLRPGYTTFKLHHFLTADLPVRTQIEIEWFAANTTGKSATELCPYLEFAKLRCPLKAYKRDEVMQQILQVPDVVDEGRLAFLAKVTTPRGALVAHIAAVIELVQDGGDTAPAAADAHDEL